MNEDWERKAHGWANSSKQDTLQLVYNSLFFRLATSSFAKGIDSTTERWPEGGVCEE
jgi:hypothetical protein